MEKNILKCGTFQRPGGIYFSIFLLRIRKMQSRSKNNTKASTCTEQLTDPPRPLDTLQVSDLPEHKKKCDLVTNLLTYGPTNS